MSLNEADTNPSAKTGEDLLDMRGKARAIDVLGDDDRLTVLDTIDQERTIQRFVEMVIEAPVDQGSRTMTGRAISSVSGSPTGPRSCGRSGWRQENSPGES